MDTYLLYNNCFGPDEVKSPVSQYFGGIGTDVYGGSDFVGKRRSLEYLHNEDVSSRFFSQHRLLGSTAFSSSDPPCIVATYLYPMTCATECNRSTESRDSSTDHANIHCRNWVDRFTDRILENRGRDELLEFFCLKRDPEQEDDASVKVEMASSPPINLVGNFSSRL